MKLRQEGLGRRGQSGLYLALPGTCQPLWFLSQALHLQNGDKNCLVARSKCFLKMGELEKSLKDAEDSLQGDPTFCKVTVGGELQLAFATAIVRSTLWLEVVEEPARRPRV